MTTQMITEAFDLKSKGYYKQAIELLYKVLTEEENNTEVLSELANLYLLLNNRERACHYAEKVLETDKDNIVCLSVLCKVNLEDKDFEKSYDYAKRCYETEDSQENLSLLLKILNLRHRFEDTVTYTDKSTSESAMYEVTFAKYNLLEDITNDLDKILEINGNNSEALLLAGNFYFDKKEFKKSEEYFARLINTGESYVEAYNKSGLICLDRMELDKASQYFLRALKLNEKSGLINYNLAQTYFLKGWLDEAKKYFTKSVYIEPENKEYKYSLAYLHYRAGDTNKALQELPKNHLASEILALKIKSQEGNYAIAKTGFEKLLVQHPNNELLCSELARVYFKLGMYKQAKKLLIELVSKNKDMKDALQLLCEILIETNSLDEAENYINEFRDRYGKFLSSFILVAKLANAKGDAELLYETAQKIIELDSNCSTGYYYNSLALFEQSDINFAIESLKKAISLDVNNSELYVKMSEFYQSIGEYENALAYITEAADIDNSEKNRELYKKLADIVRKRQ